MLLTSGIMVLAMVMVTIMVMAMVIMFHMKLLMEQQHHRIQPQQVEYTM